ncbi:MAG: hypothetical protein AB8C02_04480 [Halioglobus sp.]
MNRKYILFHTGKAAVFLFYAIVFLLLVLVYAGLTQDVPKENTVGSAILYLMIVVFYAFRIDRPGKGKV